MARLILFFCSAAVFAQSVPPIIWSNPQDVTVPTGSTAWFYGYAGGTEPLTYRWFHGTQEIPGVTSATLILSNVTSAEAGEYFLRVSNVAGSATSAPASLVVLPLLPGMLDLSFDASNGPNGVVRSVVPDSDGRIYIGGDFFYVNGFTRGYIARLESDGRLDLSFPAGPGANSSVFAVVVQTNRQVLIGGQFTMVNGTARNSLARLNPDGTVDASFNANIFAGAVWTIALQSDGKILIGGDFTQVAGALRSRIARLNSDGTLDTSFAPGSSFNDSVRAILVQPDGAILLAGAFTTPGATQRNRIARLTSAGFVDTSFNPGSGADYWVNALALQPDGKVILGGSFSTINGVSRSRLARLNSNGSLDTSFNQGAGPIYTVTSMALQPDGKLIVGGGFSQINQETHNYFARLTSEGAIDPTFYADAGASYWVEAVALQSDGKILLGGEFGSVNGVSRARVARLLGGDPAPFAPLITVQPERLQILLEGQNVQLVSKAVGFPVPFYQWQFNGTNLPGANSTLLQFENIRLARAGNYQLIASNSLGSITSRVAILNVTPARMGPGAVDINFYAGDGPDGAVTSVSAQSDGRTLIAGYFSSIDSVPQAGVARLNFDGSLDTSFQPVVSYSANQIAALPSGGVLIAGAFGAVNGMPQSALALLTTNGVLDTSFHPQFQSYPTIYSFFAQSNQQVVISGNFVVTNFDGLSRTNLARLNSDGSVDPGFDPGLGPNNSILGVAAQADGKILVAGSFGYFDGLPRNGIVRLNTNGTVDTTFYIGSGANSIVNALAVQPDGKIIIVGIFRSFNGMPRHQVARLNSDGSLDSTFDPGPGPNAEVSAVRVLRDGKIMIAGGFVTVNQLAFNHVARLNSDGSLDLTFNPGSGANDNVLSVAELPDGNLMLGGTFTRFDQLPRPYIVRLLGSNPPPFTPMLTGQPQSQIVQAGEDVTFTVLAGGVPTPSYQWQFNDTDIPGATQWILTLHNVHSTNAGNYRVVVSNAGGSVTSSNATLSVEAPSRNAGTPDINFYTGLGPNDRVHAIAVQSDRKILIGGAFTEVNGLRRSRIARLNHNGDLDPTFDPGVGPNERVFALAVQPDGNIIAGGSFTAIGNVSRSRIARFDTNGLVDLTFDPGLGANAEVYAVAVQPNGGVLVGGRFTIAGGVGRNGFARFLPNGAIDLFFVPALDYNAIVYTLAVQADGKIIAGGIFSTFGFFHSRLARFNPNGSLDPTFNSSGASSTVSGVGVQDDGKIALAGDFFNVNGTLRIRVARLQTNGTVDLGFMSAGANRTVNALQVQPDGKVVIGGLFATVGNSSFLDEYGQVISYTNFSRPRIARLDNSGLVDTEFKPGSGLQGGSSFVNEYGEISDLTTVLTLASEIDGKILVGGDFTRVNGIARPFIARLFGREASDAVAVLKGQGMVQIAWDTGILQVADELTGPWIDVRDAESPLLFQAGGGQKFFRLKFN